MRPGVSNLPRESLCETPVDPNLQRLVVRYTVRLAHGNAPKIWEDAISIRDGLRRISHGSNRAGECRDHRSPPLRRNLIDVHPAPPNVRTMVSDVRKFGYCIFDNFTGDCYVPLPALRWSEVLVYGVKARAVADAGDGILQTGIDCIQTAKSRIVAKLGISVAAPVGINHRGPGRVTGQAQDIFDHVRAAHETTKSRAHCCLAITLDVPGHTYSWLETLVIWMP